MSNMEDKYIKTDEIEITGNLINITIDEGRYHGIKPA